jgi:exodeoxyribonuclease V beta subunit
MSSELDPVRCNLQGVSLVEASAGTGKTWNICGLYARLLLELDLNVSQILVVTFTQAATAELRDRIRMRLQNLRDALVARDSADALSIALLARLTGAAGRADVQIRQALNRALLDFDNASITTIHGFCQRALADVPLSIGQPLALDLVESDEELADEVARGLWREHVASSSPDSALSCWVWQERLRAADVADALRLHDAKPTAEIRWPEVDAAAASVDWTALIDSARAAWDPDQLIHLLEDASSADHLNRTRIKPEQLPRRLDRAVRDWHTLLAQGGVPQARPQDGELRLFSRAYLDACTKKSAPRVVHPFLDAAQPVLDALAQRDREGRTAWLKTLARMLDEGRARLRTIKRARRLQSFDDLLGRLREALLGKNDPELAQSLRDRFPAALIDEFQDTDPVQYDIFRSIYANTNQPLFLVGDPKQAIYSFRNADLQVYLRAARAAQHRYALLRNFRSSQGLIDGLNALWSMSPRPFLIEGLAYQTIEAAGARLGPLYDTSGGPAEPLQVRRWAPPEDGQACSKALSKKRVCSDVVAEIVRLLAAADRGNLRISDRPVAPADIAVLVRTRAQGQMIKRVLSQAGVGSVELTRESVFASLLARDLGQVLRAIIQPGDLTRVRTALATRLLGLGANELESLARSPDGLLRWSAQLRDWQNLWRHRGIGAMLRELGAQMQVAQRLMGTGEGERQLTNLRHLIDLLAQQAGRGLAPDALLRWFLRQVSDPPALEEAQLRLESDQHLVQIVTVHRSKGLEYPIVFCPFEWDDAQASSTKSLSTQWRNDAGQVIDYRSTEEGLPADIEMQRKLATASERLRLTYVALTRAALRCYLYGGIYRVGTSTTQACRANINWLVLGHTHEPQTWMSTAPSIDAVERAWSGLAARCNSIHLSHIGPDCDVPVWAGKQQQTGLLALPAPDRIPAPWRVGSYTGLLRASDDHRAVDHDLFTATQEVQRADTDIDATPIAATDILRFARGAAAGVCIHRVFELADFTDRSTWSTAAAQALSETGSLAPLGQQQLLGMLEAVTSVELLPGLRLDRIKPGLRLNELEFMLPATELRSEMLIDCMRRHGFDMPDLSFSTLRGYLRGFIDLVFEHEGRFYLVDWKSNHLGERATDYTHSAMCRAMDGGRYWLQLLLYCVALHRFLRHSQPEYDYDTHVGGALYLFVRGVRPGWAMPDGTPCGVQAYRPTRQLIEQLSALLDGPSSAVPSRLAGEVPA